MPSDDALWQDYAAGVKPVKKKERAHSVQAKTKIGLKKKDVTLSKLKAAEKNPIEARLDLHGMTQIKAHAALSRFITDQIKGGRRRLLIITGKGKESGGVLRNYLQGWLEALPQAERIAEISQAEVRHGGSGAFYVVLRKK